MSSRYLVFSALIIIAVFSAYIIKFYLILNYNISNDSATWAQLGDYAGGLLNPILSFISIALLIKSLNLQNEANASLRRELNRNAKNEKLRSFETLFFNMINSQKDLFESFKINVSKEENTKTLTGAKAVIEIENGIETIRSYAGEDAEIQNYLENIDSADKIFGLSRAFYILVKITSDKLSDSEGFSLDDRESHFSTLINFTDFSQLRLIIICTQFQNYESARYLKGCNEFKVVLERLGLQYDLY